MGDMYTYVVLVFLTPVLPLVIRCSAGDSVEKKKDSKINEDKKKDAKKAEKEKKRQEKEAAKRKKKEERHKKKYVFKV